MIRCDQEGFPFLPDVWCELSGMVEDVPGASGATARWLPIGLDRIRWTKVRFSAISIARGRTAVIFLPRHGSPERE